MLKNSLFLILLTAIFLSACENDLDINAPWKDTTVVFGLLNKSDSVHYVRVSKAFQGEGDALIFAQESDSIYYDPSQIKVTVTEILNSSATRTFTLIPDSSIAKDPGIFSNPFQVIYKFFTPDGQKLNPEAEYRLEVKNLKNENVLTGSTLIVGDVQIQSPQALANLSLPQSIGLDPDLKTTLKWKSAVNAKVFEGFFRFKYEEYPEGHIDQIVAKVVELSLGKKTVDITDGGDQLSLELTNLQIYQALSAYITPSTLQNPMVRIADSLEFVLNSGSEDYYTYLSVNQPSNTVAQEKPQFNNVENGLGLFSSRGSFKRALYLNDAAVGYLIGNPLTQPINFRPR